MDQWTDTPGRIHGRYRWFRASLVIGSLLAILLVADSVANYVFVSRRIVVEQLRHDMNKESATLERQLHRVASGNLAALKQVFAETAKDRKTGWMELRDHDGRVLARTGLELTPSFSEEQVRNGMAAHEPITTLRNTSAGRMIVELFPIHLPTAPNDHRPPRGMLELAMPLDGANTVFWPLRQNLIINCSAALALLAALVVIGLRFRGYMQGKQLEQQLDLARSVQQDLLPEGQLRIPDVQLAAECIPAWGVGGDFYDVFPVSDGESGGGVGLVLGDVSGKGMPAALLMGVIHGAVRSSSWAESSWQHEDASARLNSLLCERTSGARFASMFWAYYHPSSETLHYINAGHCPPLVVQTRQGRTQVRALEGGGPVLGLLPGVYYQQSTEALKAGDSLILYSDGVVEAANAAGEQFGEDRLRQVVEDCAAGDMNNLRDRILQAVRSFTRTRQFDDDLTLLAVQFGTGSAAAGFHPEHSSTGMQGYFGNAGEVSESLHR